MNNGSKDQKDNAPTFQVDDKNHTGQEQYGNNVFAVDKTETQVSPGVTHAGWVKVTHGTGQREGRTFMETLSTARITTDAETTDDQGNTVTDADSSEFPNS